MQSQQQKASPPEVVCHSSTEDDKITEMGCKKWNLMRSAESLKTCSTAKFTAAGSSSSTVDGKNKKQKLMVKRIGEMEKEEKMPSFAVGLNREDIVVDLLALTGKTPAKKPKRRAGNVQKKINELIPGAELQTITMARYKVSAKKQKKKKKKKKGF